jgi:hypothetical protein
MIVLIAMFTPAFSQGAVATTYQVNADLIETHVVEEYDHNAYKLHGEGKSVAVSIKVQSGGNVDFYLFTDGHYNNYNDPQSPYIFFEAKSEHAQIYLYSGSDSSYIVVVDNDAVTQKGAMPTNNVTYTVNITYQDLPPEPEPIDPTLAGGLICGTLLVLAVVTVAWLYTVPKQYKEKAKKLKEMTK